MVMLEISNEIWMGVLQRARGKMSEVYIAWALEKLVDLSN